MRPTLTRRSRQPQAPTPDRIIAFVPGEEAREFLTRVARGAAERQLSTPEGVQWLLLLAQLEDAENFLALSRGRRKATLQRRVEALRISAAKARAAANLP